MGLFDKLLGKRPKNSTIENIVTSSNSKERAEFKADLVKQKPPVKEPEAAKRSKRREVST